MFLEQHFNWKRYMQHQGYIETNVHSIMGIQEFDWHTTCVEQPGACNRPFAYYLMEDLKLSFDWIWNGCTNAICTFIQS